MTLKSKALAASAALALIGGIGAASALPANAQASSYGNDLSITSLTGTCANPAAATAGQAANDTQLDITPPSGATLGTPALTQTTAGEVTDGGSTATSIQLLIASPPTAGAETGTVTFSVTAGGCTDEQSVSFSVTAANPFAHPTVSAVISSTDAPATAAAVTDSIPNLTQADVSRQAYDEETITVVPQATAAYSCAYSPALPSDVTGSADGCTLTSAGGAVYLNQAETVTVTDSLGAVTTGTFDLTVNEAAPAYNHHQSGIGDFVNAYGNGIDVWQRKFRAGADLRGWTATRKDPATEFILIDESDPSAPLSGTFRIEAYNGTTGNASGLCVQDDGDAVLATCDYAATQVFSFSGGHVAASDGDILTPDGTGGILSFTVSGAPWPGGSSYAWKTLRQLP